MPNTSRCCWGGWSSEREVSLRSGHACADALERRGYRVTRVDVARDIAMVLDRLKPDAALMMLHGKPGEDGTIQGVLETLGIPYSHSGVLASSLAMQKDLAKTVMATAGIPVAEGLTLSRAEVAERHVMAPPYVIKPVADGSSVGVFIVTENHPGPPQELIREDWPHGDRLLVEKYVAGKELTCAVVKDEPTGVIEIVPSVKFYDYEAKYSEGGSNTSSPRLFYHCLPGSPKVNAGGACGAWLPGREPCGFPLRRPHRGNRWPLLPRGQHPPGMTETSLVPELAAFAGTTFDELVQWMVEDASLDR